MKLWQEKVELKNQNIFGVKMRKEMEKLKSVSLRRADKEWGISTTSPLKLRANHLINRCRTIALNTRNSLLGPISVLIRALMHKRRHCLSPSGRGYLESLFLYKEVKGSVTSIRTKSFLLHSHEP
jgi:hypothetical protein